MSTEHNGSIKQDVLRDPNIITKRKDGSIRVQLSHFEDSITDQSSAQELTMASIVKKLERGQMPQIRENLMYGEAPPVRNLQDVFAYAERARAQYDSLPAQIKQLCNNDYRNLEKVMLDPKNGPVLEEHGLIQRQAENLTAQSLETLKNIDKKLDTSKKSKDAP